jgi:hypothetical protein
MRKWFSAMAILSIGLLTLLDTGKSYAYNQYGHEELLKLSVDYLNNFLETRDAHDFFTGNNHPANPNNLDLRDMALFKRCLMCPDCYSTTEPDEEIAENFLSEANLYNAQGQRPLSNDPIWSDLDQIKQCTEDLYSWIDGMYPGVVNLKKAAQETLLFPDDPNRALYRLLPVFPIRGLDSVVQPNPTICKPLGVQYASYYLMADWFAHTGNVKLEHSIYAIDYYRQDDIQNAFCMLASVLQWSQHATVPFKNRRPPEHPPANVNEAVDTWCRELIHGIAYVDYSNEVDGVTPVPPTQEPSEYPGTFLDAVNYAITTAGANYRPLFNRMDGMPSPSFLFCPAFLDSPPDDYPSIYNTALPDAVYWGASILFNYYKKIVEPYLGLPPYPAPENFILIDVHGLPTNKSATLTPLWGLPTRAVSANHFTYYAAEFTHDIDIQRYIDYNPLLYPPCSYEFDYGILCSKPFAVCPFGRVCQLFFDPHITFDGNEIAHLYYVRCMPIGGVIVPVSKAKLLAPWIGLASLMIIAAVGALVLRRHKG